MIPCRFPCAGCCACLGLGLHRDRKPHRRDMTARACSRIIKRVGFIRVCIVCARAARSAPRFISHRLFNRPAANAPFIWFLVVLPLALPGPWPGAALGPLYSPPPLLITTNGYCFKLLIVRHKIIQRMVWDRCGSGVGGGVGPVWGRCEGGVGAVWGRCGSGVGAV